MYSYSCNVLCYWCFSLRLCFQGAFNAGFFDHRIKDRNDEDGDDCDGHAAEGGDGHRDHDIGTFAGRGQDGQEGEDGGGDGHEGGADASFAGGDDGFADVRYSRGFDAVEDLFDVGGDDDAIVGGDAEQGEEADPDGDGEVVGLDLEELAEVDAEE